MNCAEQTYRASRPTDQAVPDVSIVLCTRNRSEQLKGSIATVLAAMDHSALHSELILVDNGSIDATPATIDSIRSDRMDVVARREQRAGLGFARNNGVAATRGTAVLFTDDDVHVPLDWIDALAVPLLRGTADGVMGPVVPPADYPIDGLSPAIKDLLAYCPIAGDHPERLLGANMVVSQHVFQELSFDQNLGSPAYPGWEDVLFSWQMRDRGLVLRGVEDAGVVHHFDLARLDGASLTRQVRGYGKGDAYVRYHWHHDDHRFKAIRLIKSRIERTIARHLPSATLERHLDAEWQYALHREMFRLRNEPRRYRGSHGPDERPAGTRFSRTD